MRKNSEYTCTSYCSLTELEKITLQKHTKSVIVHFTKHVYVKSITSPTTSCNTDDSRAPKRLTCTLSPITATSFTRYSRRVVNRGADKTRFSPEHRCRVIVRRAAIEIGENLTRNSMDYDATCENSSPVRTR